MRILLVVVLIVAAAWGGYWFVGARAVEAGLTRWFEDRREEGWTADYATLDTRGFPNRFDTTITDLHLAEPDTGLTWTAPVFQILALSYKPNHIIAVWPATQIIATSLQRLSIAADTFRASLVLRPGPSLELDRTILELSAMQIASTDGWSASLETGSLATRHTVGRTDAHDIGLDVVGVRPSRELLDSFGLPGTLPDVFDHLHIETTVAFDAPWNRFAIEDRHPQMTAFGLNRLDAKWGAMELHAAGELTVDAGGVPSGRIEVRARHWREMMDLAVAGGLVSANLKGTVLRALEVLAGLSGDPATLEVPLSFQNGLASFGPIPLGPAPSFLIR